MIQDRFAVYHKDNPKVYELFIKAALDAQSAGARKIGAKFLMERVRWEMMVVTHGDSFKINNTYTSRYARLLLDEHPHLAHMFETRRLLVP